MPNQRAPGQRLINVAATHGFIKKVDDHLEELGYSDRSKFIRDAIVEKAASQGVIIPPHLAMAPGRAGKGGAKKFSRTDSFPEQRQTPLAMNEAPISSAEVGRDASKAAASRAIAAARSISQKNEADAPTARRRAPKRSGQRRPGGQQSPQGSAPK